MGYETKSNENINTNPAQASAGCETEADVLYQKLGDRWYAFSLIDDEVFFGSIGAEELSGQNHSFPLKEV